MSAQQRQKSAHPQEKKTQNTQMCLTDQHVARLIRTYVREEEEAGVLWGGFELIYFGDKIPQFLPRNNLAHNPP